MSTARYLIELDPTHFSTSNRRDQMIMLWNNMVLSCPVLIFSAGICHADDREELISYFQLQASNWASIKQMDVLVRTDESREASVSPGFAETTHERIILDWEANRFSYLRIGSRSTVGSDEKQESVENGFIIKDGLYRSFLPAARERPATPFGSIEQVFDDHRMPDLRTLMFMEVSRGSKTTWTQRKSNAFHIYPQTAQDVRSLGVSEGKVQYELISENRARFRWHFDAKQLMPLQTQWLMDFQGDGKPMVVGNEHLTWKEFNGIFVPVTIQGDYVDRQITMSAEEMRSRIAKLEESNPTPEAVGNLMKELYVDVTKYRDVKLHWASVNKPLKDDHFDFSLIDHPDRFVAMANPGTIGATELQDRPTSIP